jgi:hypothetical protein
LQRDLQRANLPETLRRKEAMKSFLRGSAVGGVAAALVLGATAALAGNGVGGVFNLGEQNTVNESTSLRGATPWRNLQITNTGSGSALGLKVDPGEPPMAVNSSGKVTHLNADELDGLDSDQLQRAYKRTIVVSPRATATGSGTALREAVDGITGASASNRFLVEIEPGVYDLGSEMLQMKAFVDVEGSGVGRTIITGAGGNDWFDATVGAGANTELRDLSVESTGGGSIAVAIVANSIGQFAVRWVDAKASGGTDNAAILVHGGNGGTHAELYASTFSASGGDNAYGVYYSGGCTATMNLVEVSASGAAMNNWGLRHNRCNATPIRNSRITSTGIGIEGDSSCGLFCVGAGPYVEIQNSFVHGATNSIHSGCCFQTRVMASMLSGGALSSPFTNCIYVWDENFSAASATACP